MPEIRKIVHTIKRQLTLDDSESHKQAIFCLWKALNDNENNMLHMKLLDTGVISDVIKILNPENRRTILECVLILAKNSMFYSYGLVDETITSITQSGSMKFINETRTASDVLLTIVEKVFSFDKTRGIQLIYNHADELLHFMKQSTFGSFSLLSITKLLNFIIKYGEKSFKQKQFTIIIPFYIGVVDLLLKIEDDFIFERVHTVCCISTSVVNLCYEIENSDTELNLKYKKDVLEFIKYITIDKITSFLKQSNINLENADDFTDFLNIVITLNGDENKEVCEYLLKNSFLVFLLEWSVCLTYFRRVKLCKIISKIIMNLKESLQLPIENWQGGSSTFQTFLCRGLQLLPNDPKLWEDRMIYHDESSNSLLVLVYCHFIGTQEKYIFSQSCLALKLTRGIEKYKEPIIFKALWLLYSVSALTSRVSRTFVNNIHSKAIRNLAKSLQKHGKIELYYTHHQDLLLYSIREIAIPEGLRIKVIRFWLDKSNSDKEFNVFINECLNQGYGTLRIIKFLIRMVHENCMINLNNIEKAYEALLQSKQLIPEEVVEFVLTTLVEDLATFTPSNSNTLKIELRFSCQLPVSKSISINVIRKCAMGIAKTVIREDIDMVLKTLLITKAVFVIQQSLVYNDSKVAEIFLKNDQFLEELYRGGFFLEEKTMSEVCIWTLTCLIFCQNKFHLQRKSVTKVTFSNLETLLSGMIENKCTSTFGVEFIALLLRNKIKKLVIKLQRSKEKSDLKHLYNIYFLVHVIHAETLSGEEEKIYQCLSIMLDYCYSQKLNINIFLSCPATPFLVEVAIQRSFESSLPSVAFLNFAITWLKYRKGFREANKIKFNPLIDKSVDLLIKYQSFVSAHGDSNNITVKDFCIAVSNL